MENKINIAEILKDCPKGMELYSPIYGKVELLEVDSNSEYSIKTVTSIGRPGSFTPYGRLYENYPSAECLIFPSREMCDWTKFFKRGDVVIKKGGGMAAVFDGWANDTYTEFNTTINLYGDGNTGEEKVCDTLLFRKATEEECKQFVKKAERILKGKYDPDTLQVESVKPEYPFKPFDKVLGRDNDKTEWEINFFSRYNEKEVYSYHCLSDSYRQCIPYEGNEHLLGTTNHTRKEATNELPPSLKNVKFRETAHIAYEDEYVTAYQSTDIVPTIYKSVKTPRDKSGLASGKPKTYYRTRYSEWVTEKTFITQYQKIREKF